MFYDLINASCETIYETILEDTDIKYNPRSVEAAVLGSLGNKCGRQVPLLGPNHTLTDEALRSGSRKGNPVYEALEVVCKGPEVLLPDGMSFKDKEGKIRHEIRIAWWKEDCSTYKLATAQGPPELTEKVPDTPLASEWQSFRYRGPPVVFGHYWFTGTPAVISPRVACVDYSAAREGHPLVAYRWSGESELRSANFDWVKSR
jgi:hypothetical protein